MTSKLLRPVLGALAASCLFVPMAFADDADVDKEAPVVNPNDPEAHDPIEGLNRAIFEVNGVFYEVTTPIVEATPDPIRGLFKAIGAAVSAPVHIVTAIATGDQENDDLADIARENGVDCGFYVVLPLAGPTTSRDATGEAVEFVVNPANQLIVLSAANGANERIEAEVEIRELDNAVDEYAMARSATLQNRGCIVTDEADVPSAFGDEEAEAPLAVGDEEASTAD
jgi:ABC-type transporter lipoprotein component MlaA